jgi:hypothetical protein
LIRLKSKALEVFINAIRLSRIFVVFALLFISSNIMGMESCDSTKMSMREKDALKNIIREKFDKKIKFFFHSIGALEGEPKSYYLEIKFLIDLEERYEGSFPYPYLHPNPITVRVQFTHKTSNDSNLSNYYWSESGGYLHNSGGFIIDLKEIVKRDWEGNVLKRTCEIRVGRDSNVYIYNRTQGNVSLGDFWLFSTNEILMSFELNPKSNDLTSTEEPLISNSLN